MDNTMDNIKGNYDTTCICIAQNRNKGYGQDLSWGSLVTVQKFKTYVQLWIQLFPLPVG